MLEFIVLGQIPGTHIVLSFGVIAPLLVAAGLTASAYYLLGFSVRAHLKRYQRIIDISL